jgi:N-glycosylase/DNA lyase
MIVFDDVRDFDIGRIFECGQAFRWNRDGYGGYTGVAGGRAGHAAFAPSPDDPRAGKLTIRILGAARDAGPDGERAFWANYFDLGRDYGEINRALTANDETMARVIAYGEGIRVLNQDAAETLVSFIISQNNNIPRIKGCVERLCANFGEPIEGADGAVFHCFPSLEKLSSLSEDELAPCGLGYRARYIRGAARQVMDAGGEAWLEGLRRAAPAKAKLSLLKLLGVGEKVASCVLLFGLGMTEGFPVDVWMARAVREFYGVGEKEAAEYAAARFGDHAGIAQQYLYYYIKGQAARGV